MSDNGFRFGDWQIDPDSNTLRTEGAATTVEPKAMDVLRYLCRHAGAVIPPEELLQACWGNAELGDNPIHKAITQLRRALGDSASEPRYIETVRKRGYRAIAPVMAGEQALEGSWQQGSPFRGLESFQESHAAIFFGRMQATAQLRELVLRQASDGCAMALVLGPSGSGKTSLVRAGLLPGLMASRTGSGEPVALACTLYMDCADLADGNLFQALAAVLMDAEVGGKLLFAGENAEGLGRWLESSDAETIAGRLTEASGRIKIGLFVDRLEAIFRAPGVTDAIRSRFIAVLEDLASSKAVLLMLACRNDFYPEVIALPALMALKSRGGHFDLNPPDGAEIAQMVRMPAKAAGLKFEVDPATGVALDDVLCDAARGSPDALPLLQYCLDELYRQRTDDGTLRFAMFQQLGGIEGAIAVRAEQVVAGLAAPQSGALPQILSLIVDVAEKQGTVIARRAPWSALEDVESRQLVQALVEARLFVSELAGDIPSFGAAHEALLRRWPRVTSWLEKHRQSLYLRNQIISDAERWHHADRPRDLLLPAGIRINQARDLVKNDGRLLTAREHEYIQNSLARVKRTERIRLGMLALVILLAVIAIASGLFAKRSQVIAESRRIEAEDLMSYMLGDFSDKLRPLGKLELLDSISIRAFHYLSDPKSAHTSNTSLEQRAKSLHVIAEVSRARGQIPEAISALQSSRAILQKLQVEKSSQKSLVKEAGVNAFWLGQVYLDKGEMATAEKFFLEYLRHCNHLYSLDPNDLSSKLEQSYAHNNLGGIYLKQGKLDDAIRELSLAIKIKQYALDQQPNNINYAGELANSISFLASAKARLGMLEQARMLYQQEEKILTSLRRTDNSAQWSYRLASSQLRQGDLLMALGYSDAARDNYSRSASLFQTLVQRDATNLNWQQQLYSAQLKKIESAPLTSSVSALLSETAKILENIEVLNKATSKRSDSLQLLAKGQRIKTTLYIRLSDFANAASSQDKAMQILNGIYEKSRDTESARIDISHGLLAQAEIHRLAGSQTESIAACNRVIDMISPVTGSSNDYRLITLLARALKCVGNQEKFAEQVKKLTSMAFKDERFFDQPPLPQTKGSS